VWVGNTYLPPAQNLTKRNIDEQVARSYVSDIFAAVPLKSRVIICGDFNTRVGDMAPSFSDEQVQRISADKVVCQRAHWLLELCN
jgi:hypothetical protein